MTDRSTEHKGTFRPWSEESIEWYERASEYTRYHEELAALLLPYLLPEDHCCELACGTGTLARTLAPRVAEYTANDIDEAAIAHNESMRRADTTGRLEGMKILPGNWKTVTAGKQYDTVLFSFFGAVLRNWEPLQAIARRQIIAITYGGDAPRHPEDKKRKQEHAEDIISFLEEKGIPYETVYTELEFGQPLQNPEEAARYTRYYYPLKEEQIAPFLEKKLTRREDGTLYFPKKKKLGIVIIRLDRED